MVSMSDELKERNILPLILIVRFACATLDVGHCIRQNYSDKIHLLSSRLSLTEVFQRPGR
jgi:hypothetical protein